MLWLKRGGVFALANIRGGEEYGEPWHQGGMRENKQNSFDDFIAGAEWLIENYYTTPSRLAITGASSGGLLVAASVNQRPDLFGAAVVEVGLLNMLRFHLFTVGRFWIQEHGNPDDPHDYAYLKKYSPCHNVREGVKYPSILVCASETDDRVVPSHSYKYLMTLQSVHGKDKMLLRLNSNGGHNSAKSVDWINERADILTFIYQELEE
ncbi:MAG: prolyl oligopeptidase family serine peptidase [Parachlamydiaceae bacterium]|nr:prolyl oligopeptidase family serine peptidase [Parachlamydiaceae bacterium]